MRSVGRPLLLGLLAMVAGVSLSCRGPESGREAEAAFESVTSRYIEAWKDFYPERAAGLGLGEFADRTGDRSPEAVEAWAAFNESILDSIYAAPATLPPDLRIDLRLIRSQGRTELARWRGDGAPDAFPLGRDAYAAALLRYYDMEITPEDVAERALREIREVRRLMAETAAAHWAEVHGSASTGPTPPPGDEGALVAWALGEMEMNRASTQQESLELFTRFADEAEAFVRDAGIATLPTERTLDIVLTPASAGPAQRIGTDKKFNRTEGPRGTVRSDRAASKVESLRGRGAGMRREWGGCGDGMSVWPIGMASWAVGYARCQSTKRGGSD